ncbi:endolytic transglycosylase MltG [Alkalibacterium kapii]|uniref:Endolytic murein transglycosylase n=1 Tax=Alkalibacterium kapii TaxID=426704 RepID=A0A511AVY4_9LACT|nr:endolytic transglycosylase MltG [Alkalibacterium kapii]GEK91493.1 aminodeoxychorismate lyase [Alkalibacterium kapii]
MPDKNSTKTVRKIVLSIVSILIILIIVLFVSGYKYYTSSLEPLDPESNTDVPIEIPIGSSRTDIARILEENDIIKSAFVFNYHLRFSGEEGFQAGYYLFSPSMSTEEIVTQLQEGGTPIMEESAGKLTIPEGFTVEQVAIVIEQQTDYSVDDFFELIESDDFLEAKAEEYPELLDKAMEVKDDTLYTLEGYLYPATYEFLDDTSLDGLITQMIDRMDQVLNEHYTEIENKETTVHNILTLASFVEREGITYEDREKIAGVFYNRLNEGMPLQTDVSVTYALGEHQERITYDDLDVDSPYNLYEYRGLGPGPVNNPSEDAILATLYPAETDYMYFLADLSTREVYFSETYEQHLEYKNKYLK